MFQNATSETPPSDNKRAQRLCYLALRVATHLQWNLEIFEEKYDSDLRMIYTSDV